MAIVNIENVKAKFEAGDSPRSSDYIDMIDTLAAMPDISGKQDTASAVSNAGGSTITASGATVKPLVLKGFASQTANLQEWQNSAGTVLSRVQSDGTIRALSLNTSSFISDEEGTRPYINFTVPNKLIINTRDAAYVGLTIKGEASQSANLQEWQNSAGTVVASMRGDGLFNSYWGYHTYIQPQSGVGSFMHLTNNGIRIEGYTNVTNTVFSVKGMSDQTGNLQEWQNSAGTVLAKVQSGGLLSVGNTTGTIQITSSGTSGSYPSSGAGLELVAGSDSSTDLIQAYNRGTNAWRNLEIRTGKTSFLSQFASSTVLAVKGFASQTANLTEWQNSSGSILASVDAYGTLLSNWKANIISGASYLIPLVVKGAASQSANLTEWQNSAGTVLTKVTAGGDLDFVNGGVLKVFYIAKAGGGTTVITLGGDDNLQFFSPSSRSGAGNIFIGNSTTIPSSNPTNGGALYVEGGALKFRGSSGTVTTIANA